MSFHSTLAVPLLRERGFTRVVLAREMRRGDVKPSPRRVGNRAVCARRALRLPERRLPDVRALIGGRSDNRSACAQPAGCPYRAPNAYPLSLKDLCLASYIPALLQSGVTSLKLEGRMKSAEYVYAVTKIYRRLLDERRRRAGRTGRAGGRILAQRLHRRLFCGSGRQIDVRRAHRGRQGAHARLPSALKSAGFRPRWRCR